MKRIVALKKAEEIANIIKGYAPFLNEKDINWYDGKDKKMKIFEIIFFGSTTRKCDDEFVDDIDIIVIDNGVFSSECENIYNGDEEGHFWHFINMAEEYRSSAIQRFYCEINDLVRHDIKVLMHVLPLRFFRNKKFREEVKSRHHDPDFFKNVFATAMRWRMGKQFVPVDVSYFERKYKVRLQDLKK